jgi:hypothetical protein
MHHYTINWLTVIVTSSCQSVDFLLDPQHIVQLVDTPGFNDTTRSDTDVLSAIAGWLQTNQVSIAGIVYLHRINEKRFTGANRLLLKILQSMCGQHFLPHVVLCTTMWDKIPDKAVFSEAEARESELVGAEDLWNPLLARGAKYMRYTGDRASGFSIVEALLKHPSASKMELQLELRNPGCDVEDTLAGRVITAEIRRKEEILRKQRLEEEEEERDLREQLRLEREALQRDEQKKCEHEFTILRRADRGSSGGSRNDRRPREFRDTREIVPSVLNNRDGKSRSSEMVNAVASETQYRWVLGFLRK